MIMKKLQNNWKYKLLQPSFHTSASTGLLPFFPENRVRDPRAAFYYCFWELNMIKNLIFAYIKLPKAVCFFFPLKSRKFHCFVCFSWAEMRKFRARWMHCIQTPDWARCREPRGRVRAPSPARPRSTTRRVVPSPAPGARSGAPTPTCTPLSATTEPEIRFFGFNFCKSQCMSKWFFWFQLLLIAVYEQVIFLEVCTLCFFIFS